MDEVTCKVRLCGYLAVSVEVWPEGLIHVCRWHCEPLNVRRTVVTMSLLEYAFILLGEP